MAALLAPNRIEPIVNLRIGARRSRSRVTSKCFVLMKYKIRARRRRSMRFFLLQPIGLDAADCFGHCSPLTLRSHLPPDSVMAFIFICLAAI